MEFVKSDQIQFHKLSHFLAAKEDKIHKSIWILLGVSFKLGNFKFFRWEPLGKFFLDSFVNEYKITLNLPMFEHELNIAFWPPCRGRLELDNVILEHIMKIIAKAQILCLRLFLKRFAGPG